MTESKKKRIIRYQQVDKIILRKPTDHLTKITICIFEEIFSLERDELVEFSAESNGRQPKGSEERKNQLIKGEKILF